MRSVIIPSLFLILLVAICSGSLDITNPIPTSPFTNSTEISFTAQWSGGPNLFYDISFSTSRSSLGGDYVFDLSLRSGSYLWMIYNTYVNGQWGPEVDNVLPFSEGDIFTFNIYINGDEGNFLVICTQDNNQTAFKFPMRTTVEQANAVYIRPNTNVNDATLTILSFSSYN